MGSYMSYMLYAAAGNTGDYYPFGAAILNITNTQEKEIK